MKEQKDGFNSFLYGMPLRIRNYLQSLPEELKNNAQEVRLRANQPVFLTVGGKSQRLEIIAFKEEIEEGFMRFCRSSIYSHEEEIKEGFVILENGHRLGFGGTAVIKNGQITSFKDISSLNIRISKEIIGCSNEFFEGYTGGGALIFGPPGSGKTTLLRDIARAFEKRVVIVDSKREIAKGNIGQMTDVLYNTPKAVGIQIAVKTLYPEVIIFDEISTKQEALMVAEGFNCGVAVITTAHAGSLSELKNREVFQELYKTGAINNLFYLKNGRCVKK